MSHHPYNQQEQVERDYEIYKLLLELWHSENPTKTNKLQICLLVNALLVSAVALSGGITQTYRFVSVAGILLNIIWSFSIGRTSLFQDIWQMKMREIQNRYPADPRFSMLDSDNLENQAHWLVRISGSIPSKWYLILTPSVFAIIWLVILLLRLL